MRLDRAAARQLRREYHGVLLREAPYAVLSYAHRLVVHRTALRDVTLDGRGEMAEIRGWWLNPGDRR